MAGVLPLNRHSLEDTASSRGGRSDVVAHRCARRHVERGRHTRGRALDIMAGNYNKPQQPPKQCSRGGDAHALLKHGSTDLGTAQSNSGTGRPSAELGAVATSGRICAFNETFALHGA